MNTLNTRIGRGYERVRRILTDRGYTVDRPRASVAPTIVEERGKVRVFAAVDTRVAVAAFVDFSVQEVDDNDELDETSPKVTKVSTKMIEWRVRTLTAEFAREFRQFNILLIASLQTSFPDAIVQFVRTLNARGSVHCELWTLNQLQLPSIDHVLVPVHRAVTLADVPAHLDPDHLPVLADDDPIARHWNFRCGQIVVCEREDARRGRSPYYRRVERIVRRH